MTTLTAGRKSLTLGATITKADADTGVVVAIVNSGNVEDRQRDTLLPGSWSTVVKDVNAGRYTALISWAHQINNVMLDVRGKILRLEELSPGSPEVPLNRNGGSASALKMWGQFAMDTQGGREAFALVKGGYISEWSVSYGLAEGDSQPDGKGGQLVSNISRLIEVSPVLIGASPGTATLVAKGHRAGVVPEWMTSLIEGVAWEAEFRMTEALMEAESHAWRKSYQKDLVRDETDQIVAVVRREMEREANEAIASRPTTSRGYECIVSKAVPRPGPRPLTERERLERQISWRAGIA